MIFLYNRSKNYAEIRDLSLGQNHTDNAGNYSDNSTLF